MDPRFLDILCCPNSGSDLRLEIVESYSDGTIKTGFLISTGSPDKYPIINGIPRFVDKEHYASSFGYEWKKWSRVQFESENSNKTMAGYTKRMFDRITGFKTADLKDKLVVDFGCGPGRFIEMARAYGATVVGIDLSLAVESARENFRADRNVLIVQGDITKPPFKKASFDAGYTIGVLHHTPNPSASFNRLARLVKKDGAIVCCVYTYMNGWGLYDSPAVNLYRKVYNGTKQVFGNRLALLYCYISAYLLYPVFRLANQMPVADRIAAQLGKHVFPVVYLPDGKWRLLDTFDAITPYYASTHTGDEVIGWFKEAGCQDIKQTEWCATSIRGKASKEL